MLESPILGNYNSPPIREDSAYIVYVYCLSLISYSQNACLDSFFYIRVGARGANLRCLVPEPLTAFLVSAWAWRFPMGRAGKRFFFSSFAFALCEL